MTSNPDSIFQDLRNYMGNPNLLLAGEQYQYTKEEVEEFARCANDVYYFIEKYVKIVHLDRGLIPFIPYDYQRRIIDTIDNNRFTICKLPRQCGKTTTTVAWLLHHVLFNSNIKVAILAHRAQTARELFSKVRLAYEHLPKFLQAGIVPGGWNKGSIMLGNGSSIKADATSGGSVRGEAFNVIFLDEFAFVDNNLAKEFMESVYPTISSGQKSKVIIVSTPKGMNHFWEMWDDATQKKSLFIPIEINWDDVPGRDEEWKKQQIANIGLESWNQEFECHFIGSSNTLINATTLQKLKDNWKDPIHAEDSFKIYDEPKPGHRYIICADTSRGLGLDYHAFSIIDVTNLPYKLVGVFRNSTTYIALLPSIIKNAADRYNYAHVLIEISDVGSQIADMLISDLDYDNVIRVSSAQGVGQRVGFGAGTRMQNGVKTSPATKRIGCADLKTLLENGKLIVEDKDTIQELFTFVADNQSYAAEDGYHDDLVMTLVLFGWLSHQRYFREEEKDIRAALDEQHKEYLDSQLTPFGIFDDGLDNMDMEWEMYGQR